MRSDSSKLAGSFRPSWKDHLAAVIALVVATLVTLAFKPALGHNYPFASFFLAVATVAWFGRTSSSVLVLVIGGAVASYLFAPGDGSVSIRVGFYLVASSVVVAMGHAMRRARARTDELLSAAAVQQEQLRTTLASIGDAVITTDVAGCVTYLNAAAETLTGWTSVEASGQPLTNVFSIVDEGTGLPNYNPAARAMEKRQVTSLPSHTLLISKDGRQRPIDDSAAPIRRATGDVIGSVLVFRDISERRTVEEQLRVNEARQQFLVALADALRPLLDPVVIQAEASRLLGEYLGANRVAYFEIRGDEYVVERDHVAGVRTLAGTYPVSSFGPTLLASLLAGQTVVESDATTHPVRPPHEQDAFASIDVRGHVDVPLVKGGRFVAGMTVHSRTPREWAEHEISIIVDTAERTWAAVERARSESALRESEERAAFVRRSSGVGFWYCDLPFDVLQWDELVKAHFHLPPDAVVKIQTFYERIHPDDREPTRLAIERSISSLEHYDVHYRTVNPADGATTWVRAIGRTFYAPDGTPTRFDGVTLDVSEQKSAEASLKKSEERRRLALDSAELGAWHLDVQTSTLTTDERFRQIFSGSIEPKDYQQVLAAIHPEDRERIQAAVADATRPDGPVLYAQEHRVVHPDGTVRWVFAKGRANFELEGHEQRVSLDGTVADITVRKHIEEERERLVEELRRQDQLKDEFLATLAHELRNPLAPIRNGLQIIRLAGAQGMVEQARSMMERQLSQMTRLVDDLLDVGRVTTGKLQLRRERVELQAVISAALETSLPLIEQAEHELAVDVPSEPIHVDADPIRLAQVVSNLLTNSAKYTPPGGHVKLKVAPLDDGRVVVKVADDGIGIPEHMLEAVFGMFSQVDRALERSTGGLGIGLSLAKALTELHGGTIQAYSEGQGRGSEFSVILPLAPALCELPGEQAPQRAGTASTLRILVIDDNVDAADSLSVLLETAGHEVRTAYDGAAGVEVAAEFQPGAVVCDIGMPLMNGYDTARRIRSEAWGKDIVLIALTGWSQATDLQKSSAAGFNHHLVKPVDAEVLNKMLTGPS